MSSSNNKSDEMWSSDVTDRASFLTFIGHVRHDLANKDRQIAWCNETLDEFLGAMLAWVNATPDAKASSNPWTHAAALIEAATGYE